MSTKHPVVDQKLDIHNNSKSSPITRLGNTTDEDRKYAKTFGV